MWVETLLLLSLLVVMLREDSGRAGRGLPGMPRLAWMLFMQPIKLGKALQHGDPKELLPLRRLRAARTARDPHPASQARRGLRDPGLAARRRGCGVHRTCRGSGHLGEHHRTGLARLCRRGDVWNTVRCAAGCHHVYWLGLSTLSATRSDPVTPLGSAQDLSALESNRRDDEAWRDVHRRISVPLDHRELPTKLGSCHDGWRDIDVSRRVRLGCPVRGQRNHSHAGVAGTRDRGAFSPPSVVRLREYLGLVRGRADSASPSPGTPSRRIPALLVRRADRASAAWSTALPGRARRRGSWPLPAIVRRGHEHGGPEDPRPPRPLRAPRPFPRARCPRSHLVPRRRLRSSIPPAPRRPLRGRRSPPLLPRRRPGSRRGSSHHRPPPAPQRSLSRPRYDAELPGLARPPAPPQRAGAPPALCLTALARRHRRRAPGPRHPRTGEPPDPHPLRARRLPSPRGRQPFQGSHRPHPPHRPRSRRPPPRPASPYRPATYGQDVAPPHAPRPPRHGYAGVAPQLPEPLRQRPQGAPPPLARRVSRRRPSRSPRAARDHRLGGHPRLAPVHRAGPRQGPRPRRRRRDSSASRPASRKGGPPQPSSTSSAPPATASARSASSS